MRSRRAAYVESLLAFCLVAFLSGRAGMLSARSGQVNWEGLAAIGHAQDLWYRAPEPRLTEVGFVQPPLPSLLASVAVWPRPHPEATPFAPVRLGALLLGLTAVIFLAMTRRLRLAWPWRYGLTAALVLHPVPLSQAAAGSPAALLLPLMLGSLWCLDEWAATGSLRPLLISSVLLGGAVLTRYEALLWVGLAAVLVAVVAARAGGYRQAEGTLLAFLLPTAYLGAGWIAACWLIQGDPWYFWRYTFTEIGHTAGNLLSTALYLALLCSPLLPAGAYALLGDRRRETAAASLLLGVGGLALAGLVTPLLGRLAGDAWSQLTVPLLTSTAAGYLLAARAVVPGKLRWSALTPAAVLALVTIAAVLLAGRAGGGLPRGTLEVLQGRLAFTDSVRAEQQVAQRLRAELAPQETVVVAGWPGFAVAMLEGELGRMLLLPHPLPPTRSLTQAPELLLVREPEIGALQDAWEQALPDRTLRPVWRVDSWTCYRVGTGGG